MREFSFPKSNRLKKKKHFQFVYRRGKAVLLPYAVLYVLKGKGLQIGLAVGKKLGNAVVRNHVKRMMREVFRKNRIKIKAGYHLIWVARHKLVRGNLTCYEKVFQDLCQKANLIVNEDG